MPPFLATMLAKVSLKSALWVVAALALLSAGGVINGYRWGEKYNAREIEWKEQELERAKLATLEQERIANEWIKVSQLQETYTKLNQETYDDLHKRLDALAASVERYGTRTVRVCAVRPATDPPAAKVVDSRTPAGIDPGSPRGLPRAVERDSGPGGNPEGYDLFPEVTELMVRANQTAITCNQFNAWFEKVRKEALAP